MAWALVAVLTLAYAGAYAWSAPNTDTADELMRAYEIRHGLAYPLEGPPLGGVIHLGPAWFYLTALPLWIHESWLAAALFIGLVCGLKFPLAYVCGRQLVDGDFGVLWATALFLPGWNTIENLVFLNPNGVTAAVLAILALSLRGLRSPPGLAGYALLGLAFGLAIHVHPTAIPVFAMALPLLWACQRQGSSVAGPLVAMALGFALPFVPYVMSQAAHHWPDSAGVSGYVKDQVSAANIVNLPAILWGYAIAGPAMATEYLLGWGAGAGKAIGAVLAVGAIAGAVAGMMEPRLRRRASGFVVALLAFAAFVAVMRPTTPVQFVWVLAAPVAALLATALWLLARRPALRPVVLAAVAAMILLNAWTLRALAMAAREGEGRLPVTIRDVKSDAIARDDRDIWFPALGHEALGLALCGKLPVSVHGHLAYVVDKDLGLDTLFACRERARVTLAGADGANHLLGMTRPFWRAMDTEPERWIGSLGMTSQAKALFPPRGIAVATGDTYLPRPGARHAGRATRIDVTVPARHALLVTSVVGSYEVVEVASVVADGQPVTPRLRNDFAWLYDARGQTDTPWTLTIRTTDPAKVDVVAIPVRRR